ncbi:MAG: hypothetical protein J5710_08215 [Treponema sp.]|nr:hypothetical protein [Treponema sp.]
MAQIETKFYAQTKINEKDDQLEKLSQRCNSYISQILTKIQTGDDAYLKESSVKTYVHQNPSEKEATERKNLTARLFDELEPYGLDGLRLIEKNGRTLHYSSYESDVLKRVSLNTTYKLYSDVVKDSGELEGELLLVDSDNPKTKLLLDKANNRLIISFPFYVTDNTYFATLTAYFDIHSFEQLLVNEKILNYGDSLSAITAQDSYDGGFVLGLPKNSQSEFVTPVLNVWNKLSKTANKELGLERILEKDDGSYWLLMTSGENEFFKVSAVYSSTLFELPRELEYLIYTCVFFTFLLVAALLFNLKRDYLAVIKSRIKKVQFGIINEYLENKEKVEWSQVARQLENRKAELSEEIKKSIGGKSKKYSKQVDAYLDSSWEEIIGLLKAQTGGESEAAGAAAGGATIEEIRRVIEEVLRTSKLNVNVAPVGEAALRVPQGPQPVEEVEEVEEVEALDVAEPVDEIEEVEPVEEVEALDDIEEVEEVESLDEAEPVEEIEEVEEVEEVEALDDAEPVEDIEEVEEVGEVALREPQGPQPVEDAEEIEELEEYVVDTSMFDSVDSHYSVSNDDPRFHEEYYIGELAPAGVPFEYPEGTEPLEFEFVVEEPKFTLKLEAALREPQGPQDDLQEPQDLEETEELEELSDDVENLPKKSQPYFVMTKFGQNDEPVVELVGDGDNNNNGDTIIERNGVYSISDNLSYTNVFLNQEFKTLVDSVLQK